MLKLKTSLKLKFTLIFVAIMTFLIAAMCCVNTYFLERYYRNEKVSVLESAYEAVDALLITADENGDSLINLMNDAFGQNLTDSPMISLFRALNDKSNINVVLIDQYDNQLLATSREGDWLAKKLRFYLANKDAILNGEFPNIGLPVQPTSEEAEAEADTAEESSASAEDGTGTEILTEPKESSAADAKSGASESTADTKTSGLRDEVRKLAENGEIPLTITLSKNDDYCIQQSYDRRSNTGYLESWGYFSDHKTKFIMSMPIELIHESVAIMNRFLLIVGVCVLLGGGILIYLITSRIVRPINRLARASMRMAELDFSAKYEGHAADEVGVLGRAMNTMSERLEETIAELKTANNQLRQDIDEKTKVDELRKDFIANVSHELKTPIALIEGYAEGLCEGMAEAKESREYYCGVIMDEAVKMNRMVKQLTSLNNLEFGNDVTEFARFDLAELLRSVVDAQKLKAEAKEAALSLDCPETCYVWADEFKIEEVLTNYLTNALNHVDGERNIRVTVEPGEQVRVSVYNDGAPIPDGDLERIWEKFYKVDKARTREYGGSGIGLSIVKAIMTAHNQSYGVKNEPHGVTFYFTLDACSGGKAAADVEG